MIRRVDAPLLDLLEREEAAPVHIQVATVLVEGLDTREGATRGAEGCSGSIARLAGYQGLLEGAVFLRRRHDRSIDGNIYSRKCQEG